MRPPAFRILALLGQLLALVGAEKKSRGTKSLCVLPDENMSLASLGENDYFTAENRDEKTVIYLSLCHPLRYFVSSLTTLSDSIAEPDCSRKLPPTVKDLCDENAFSCITKLNLTTQKETEHQRNAGRGTGPPVLSKDGAHVQLKFGDGGKCVDPINNSTGYSTFIDFFCSTDFAVDNAIRYEGKFGNCASQVFWHTSLACLPGSKGAAPQSGSCLLKIPGYDTSLDLSSWGKEDSYFEANGTDSSGKSRMFQLNLCNPVQNGLCSNNSVACEVNIGRGDSPVPMLLSNLMDEVHQRTSEYNELTEVITLTYEDKTSRMVKVDIKCDKSAEHPQISLLSNEGTKYHFQFLTKLACLVPPVQCTAEDQDGDLFSLALLAGIEWEIGEEDTQQKYAIKVCGSLPMNSDNPCRGQAGVCTYTETKAGKKAAPMNLGLMSQKPTINNEDHSISMLYEKGDTYIDPTTNVTCRRSAEITLICNEQEIGPRVQSVQDPCRHTLIWRTPAACPQKKAVSHNCTVREPRWSNLFNLTALYNKTNDHRITLDGTDYVFNVCGGLISGCTGKNEVCFEHEKDLSYDDGSLVMRHTSKRNCKINPNIKMAAIINFICEHGKEHEKPAATLLSDACQVEVEWRTELACPPHQEVQCSLTTAKGDLVDLSSLSLPGDNYKVQSDSGGEFTINVCRSLVHTPSTHCPYSAAACFTKSVNGTSNSNNLGQLQEGPKMDTDGKVFISYKLGSPCLDPKANRNHIETVIYFDCSETATDSKPEFVESDQCLNIFHWETAAACPVKQTVEGNCTVTSPTSGFTFNLSSLRKQGEDYHRKGSYHHFMYNIDFNLCGPLINTTCPRGSGICSADGADMGQANANLTWADEQLSLTYSNGSPCEEGKKKMETKINFLCPPRRSVASGNHEVDGPKLVQRNTKCDTTIEFYTDLACDHQVYCEVATNTAVYSLTRLRRHQHNYHVKNKDPMKPDFVLNVCGPLVPADVPRSRCNPHGACSQFNSRFQGLGRVQESPYMGDNGHLVIDYKEGGVCNNLGKQWSTSIIFTCDKSETLEAEHPLGRPEHVSTDLEKCLTVFKFPTVLACNDTTTDQIVEPDSCKIFHPGTQEYINISDLVASHPYKIESPESKTGQEYFEMQPCAKVASCKGHICQVHALTNSSKSLGLLSDFMYEPTLESVRLRYTNGDTCNSRTGKKWASKIYYTCDRNVGIGKPVVRETYDCLIIFDWRTSAFCPQHDPQPTLPPISELPLDPEDSWVDLRIDGEKNGAVGGTNWGTVFFTMLLIVTVISVIVLYK